jgi:rSAM/selenodomain-associated transferase 1
VDAAETASPRAAVLAVLTRAPASGGKSRLFAALRTPPDPALTTALLLDTLDAVASPQWDCAIVVAPAEACDDVRAVVPAEMRLLPQRGGDLGARMRAAMDDLFAAGAHAVVLVGSDLPEIDAGAVATAFETLSRDRDALVIGPAHDGGYYLIGATRTPDVFAGIEWGGAHVLDATVAAAQQCGLRVHLVDGCADVDNPDDLRRLVRMDSMDRAHAMATDAGGQARRTRAWIATSGVLDRLTP